jgi:hypothetical protein
MNFDVCQINTSKLDEDTKLPLIQATVPITSDEDYETFGEVASYQALGITALPFPPTEDGYAEGVILRDVGALNGAVIGSRDERCAGVVATMRPGDAVLHSCDPEAKAQVRVHANRQIAMVTEGTDGKSMVSMLDGKNDKITITAFGGIIEMTPDGISIVAPGSKASILMSGDQITLLGKVQLGGIAPTHVLLCTDLASITAIQALLPSIGVAGGLSTTLAP